MKKGFILPVILILISLVTAVALVLNKMSTDRTGSLSNQDKSYYSGKEITVKLVEEKISENTETPFTDAVSLNSKDGYIRFINSGHIKKSKDGILWARQDQVIKQDNWASETCKEIDGTALKKDCRGTEEFFPCKYHYDIPSFITDKNGLPRNGGALPSGSYEKKNNSDPLIYDVPGKYKMPSLTGWNTPRKLEFKGNGVYYIKGYKAHKEVKATFDAGIYHFDKIEYTTGYSDPNPNIPHLEFKDGSTVYIKDELKIQNDINVIFGKGNYYIKKLTVPNSNVSIEFGEGVYWIEEMNFSNTGAKIKIPIGEKVKIYTKNFKLTNTGNGWNTNGTPNQLLVVNTTEGITLERAYGGSFKGFVYTDGLAKLKGMKVYGAIICNKIEINESGILELYNPEGVQLPTRKSIEIEDELW